MFDFNLHKLGKKVLHTSGTLFTSYMMLLEQKSHHFITMVMLIQAMQH